MTLKSSSELVLDERSPSCSSHTSTEAEFTESYSLPLGTNTEIGFSNDDYQVENLLRKHNVSLPEASRGGTTNTIIGGGTIGDVINLIVEGDSKIEVNHHHHETKPVKTNEEPKNDAPPNTQPAPTSHPKRGLEILKRHFKFVIVAITSITLVCAIALIILQFTTNENDNITTTTTTVGTTLTPHPVHYTFTETQWGGRPSSKLMPIEVPISLLIIKHTNSSTCHDVSKCFSAMQQLQNTDVGEHKLPDIRYNFMIGGDGNIYVGRGWQAQNEQMNNTIDVAYLGNFNEDIPSDFMVAAGPWLLVKGILEGFVDEARVKVVCHNQTEVTDSPGQNLCKEVVKWKYYSDEIIFDD